MVRGIARIAAVAVLLALPSPAATQTAAGSIAGLVKDASGAVIPGVTVEASSPALIEKVRTAQTDTEGRYQIVELRPGTYTVTFTLQGFSTVRREGIELTTGFTANVNADLKVGDVTETITVSGQSPVVDLQNTKQQVVMTRDVIENVPTGRSFQNLGVLIPGVSGGQVVGSTINQDVGGGSGQSFMTLSIHGGRFQDQRIDLDGMSTSAWTRPDSSAIVFADGNIEEYNISVAGNSAETSTGGVRINLIPREGSNSFRGSFFGNYASPDLQATNNTDALRSRGLFDANRLKSMWSVNPTFGGPLQRDQLWFYFTYTYSRTDTLVGDSYLNSDPTAWNFVPDKTRQAIDDQYSKDASTRITWQASRRNKFAGYFSYNNTCHCHFLIGRANSATPVNSEASTLLFIPNYVTQVTWSSPVSNRLLLEGGFSYILENQQFNPRPESTAPQIIDSGLNVIYRATSSNLGAYTPVYGGRGSASYVTGSHALKAGFTMIVGRYDQTSRRVGDEGFTALNGVPTSVTYLGTPVLAVNRVRPDMGLYGQDQWTMKRLTVNAGLRLDIFRSDYPAQNVPATQFVPVPRSFPGLDVVSWKDLNPRFGVSYDLFGNGKTAVKASANRYVQGEGTGRASTINPILSNNSVTRTWTDTNGDRVVQGDPFNTAANGELGPSTNLAFGKPVIAFRYDPAWAFGFQNRPYNWEFSGAVQHELLPRVSVNFAYFRRIYGNFSVTDNTLVGPQDYTQYCVTEPSDPRLPDGGNERICGLQDLNANKVGQLDRVTTFASNFGNQYEHWNGFDFTMNARLAKLLLQGGVSTGRTLEDFCDVAAKVPESNEIAQPSFATGNSRGFVNSSLFCRTQSPFLSQLKLLGAYTLPYGIQLSGTFQSVPGPEVTALGTFTNAQVASSLGRNLSSATTVNVAMVEPKTQYGERMNQLDFRFGKKFNVQHSRLQATVDLYNALNGNAVLVQSNNYGATIGATTGSAWLRPQAILPARIVKFSIQANF
jgi:Carboxypeptidase regulatory-like domain